MYLQRKYKQLTYGFSYKTYPQRKPQYSINLYYKSSFFSMVTRRNIKFQLSGRWVMFSGAIQYSNTATIAIVNTSGSDNLLQFQSRFYHPYSQSSFLQYPPAVPSHHPRGSPPCFLPSETSTPTDQLCPLFWLFRPGFVWGGSSWPTNSLCTETACTLVVHRGNQARLTRIHSCSSPTWNQFLSRKDFYSSSFQEQLAVRGNTEQEKQFWRHVQPRHYRIIYNR